MCGRDRDGDPHANRRRALFQHKVRKARGYMHEVRASLPAAPGADSLPLFVFAWRAALLLTPPIALVGLIVAATLFGGLLHGGRPCSLPASSAPHRSGAGRAGLRPPGGCARASGCRSSPRGLLTAICLRPFTSISPRYPRIQLADRAREF